MTLITKRDNAYYGGNNPRFGEYQFVSITDIVNQFVFSHVGKDKIINRVPKADVAYFAKRALAELSFDTLRSTKSQEIVLPSSLQMKLPIDYVNYVKLTQSDSSGIEHVIYPTRYTSNPSTIQQNSDGEYLFSRDGSAFKAEGAAVGGFGADLVDESTGFLVSEKGAAGNSISPGFDGTFVVEGIGEGYDRSVDGIAAHASDESWVKVGMEAISLHLPPGTTVTAVTHVENTNIPGTSDIEFTLSNTPTHTVTNIQMRVYFYNNTNDTTWGKFKSNTPSENNNDNYEDDTFWSIAGERYGLEPEFAQVNGSFFIDETKGLIHFSSNLSGKTIILHYLSDSLGTDDEMVIHKFAEEAIYKWIAYSILSTKTNVQEHIIQRFKREKIAETRKAKLRLSNIKLEEITQILRGQSKQIKH